MALDRVAGACLGVDGAVGPAQPTAAERFARVLGRDRLPRANVEATSAASYMALMTEAAE